MPRDTIHILLIEEDDLLADITSFRLELLGYQVERAQTGEEGLRLLHQRLPDLVILDFDLPDFEGVDLINLLKNDPRTTNLPLLLFSIEADLERVEDAYRAGAEEYLVTPYDPMLLEQKLECLLQTSR